ncbi:shikimate kinase [Acetohalobium arabaticum]|uniref:Shikimate kinase n=1 Tax=Acetohalobium arabaticum (strain ATCC 49924 / DSM 5501 / Z-7288) TaxID=574087 RepID=D9QRX1_ACEAZ|nr:shikimate kinase [Acetohalobium arabaticum]ADL13262.1 Shikimate kinase [Acetohalobium arabaticum DSM 5501]
MDNIVLIGFMGTGKSTVGQHLSERLELEFVDSDEVIEERAGREISSIFAEYGEEYFRDLETEVITDLSRQQRLVISTGGGVVLRQENIEQLRKKGTIILLTAEPEVILDRVKDSDRPLLEVPEPLEKIKEMLADRREYYDITEYKIDTSQMSVAEVVAEIEKIISNEGG